MRKKILDNTDEVTGAANDEVATKTLVPTASALDVDFAELEVTVQRAYDEGITLDEAERLASKLLGVQLRIARELATLDLDSRMKKSGMKAARAQAYMEEVNRNEKKPSDTLLEQVVTRDTAVQKAQLEYDTADARKESLTIYLGIFREAHIHFRSISRGRFE